MHDDEKRQMISDALDAWERALTPGELEQAADMIFLGVRRDILLRMRDAIVKEYDTKCAERGRTGFAAASMEQGRTAPERRNF